MITSIYPVLMSTDVASARSFFTDLFGFEVTFTSDWYVSLRRDRWELGIVDAEHATVPQGFGSPAAGILLNIEVDDVDAEYERLVVRGPLDPELEIRSEAFGQRHFIVAGPDGVLVDVITEIDPGDEYADGFVTSDSTNA